MAPDLSLGSQWMYRYRRYTEYADGSKGDSTGFFIHYEITGDTTIAGIRYRLLVEEDLALINTDIGLTRYRTVHAVQSDSAGVRVKTLKGADRAVGRLPFKRSSGGFDTSHFQDEILAMQSPLRAGQGWIFREAGSPFGLQSATKTFLGSDTLRSAGGDIPCLRFRLEVAGAEDARIHEWYSGKVKIFSRVSASTTFSGRDTSRVEEEYLGARAFTRQDTLDVLDGAE
jgi:hypothetical protein